MRKLLFWGILFFFAESLFLFFLSQVGRGHNVIVGDAWEVYGYLLDWAFGRPFAPRPFPFGSILLFLPFFLLAQGGARLLNFFGVAVSSDPGAHFTQIVVASGSSLFGLLGLFLLYRILLEETDTSHARALVFFSVAATPLAYYLFFEPCMTHIPALFWASLFLFTLRHRKNVQDDFLLGSTLGILTLTRTLDVFYGLLVLPGLLRRKDFRGILAFGGAWALFFSFQLLLWKIQFGFFFVQPYGRGFIQYGHPRLFSFFFSTNHGLFLWHPYFFLSLLGLLFLKTPFRPLEALIVFVQSYINSAARDWFGGDAFGQRRMISRLPLFSFGFLSVPEGKRRWLYALLFLCSLFNFWLLWRWKLGVIPPQGKIPLSDLFFSSSLFLPTRL